MNCSFYPNPRLTPWATCCHCCAVFGQDKTLSDGPSSRTWPSRPATSVPGTSADYKFRCTLLPGIDRKSRKLRRSERPNSLRTMQPTHVVSRHQSISTISTKNTRRLEKHTESLRSFSRFLWPFSVDGSCGRLDQPAAIARCANCGRCLTPPRCRSRSVREFVPAVRLAACRPEQEHRKRWNHTHDCSQRFEGNSSQPWSGTNRLVCAPVGIRRT